MTSYIEHGGFSNISTDVALLKIRNFDFWVGRNDRETGVYMSIHEDCEVISNTARKQKINFHKYCSQFREVSAYAMKCGFNSDSLLL